MVYLPANAKAVSFCRPILWQATYKLSSTPMLSIAAVCMPGSMRRSGSCVGRAAASAPGEVFAVLRMSRWGRMFHQ